MSRQKYPQAASTTSLTGESRSKKRANYSHKIADARQDRKRIEAHARQLEHDDLTPDEKIAKAKTRRGESKREITRLTKGLEWEKAQRVTAKAKEANPVLPADLSVPVKKAKRAKKETKE